MKNSFCREDLGAAFEVDITTHRIDESEPVPTEKSNNGGLATTVWAPPAPTLMREAELPEQDEYEVLIYDEERGQTLVAAIEIVSPSNKDRPESRRAVVAKMAALMQRGVCVSIVDLVTIRQFNLYTDLLELLGQADPKVEAAPTEIYAVTVRSRKRLSKRPILESWFYPLALGQILPTLPIWLEIDRAVSLELEATYEDTCHVLHIR